MSVALADELHRLEQQRSTGVLRAGDGEFHFADGAITSAGCRRTPGLDRLVVEAGVATAEDWRRAGSGDPDALPHGPRLETLAVLSVYDAAYFLLASPAEPEFVPAPEHWLSNVCRVAPHAVVHECARRGDPEFGPWPAELVATQPVVPAQRTDGKRVVLTGSQAEVLAAVDSRRSIADIARDLGRTTYGCLVAVRDLTAAGLIEAPVARRRHLALAPEPAPRRMPRPTTGVPELPRRVPNPPRPTRPLLGTSGSGRHALDEEATASVRYRGVRPYQPERWQPVDRDLLIRLKAALEELA
ncbi:hypothetical protein [Nocardia sp. AG03]|uniref:hypothetical protein n=1 Tax=Nocardia sp. AG03 TaxID=3025312 RepID=UPI0024182E41|nr:hypothetical protein [Nocardia sp. AG03]